MCPHARSPAHGGGGEGGASADLLAAATDLARIVGGVAGCAAAVGLAGTVGLQGLRTAPVGLATLVGLLAAVAGPRGVVRVDLVDAAVGSVAVAVVAIVRGLEVLARVHGPDVDVA